MTDTLKLEGVGLDVRDGSSLRTSSASNPVK